MKPKKHPNTSVIRVLSAVKTKIFLLICVFIMSAFGVLLSNWLMTSQTAFAKVDLLQSAPTQPLGYYDYFGKLLSPQEAAEIVVKKGLDPNDPISYQRVGAVKITQELIAQGENIFFNHKIGDTFGLQGVFGLGQGSALLAEEYAIAVSNLQGQPTNNLQITLLKDIPLGSRTFLKGTVINTGLKVDKGGNIVGSAPNGNITCAICHVTLSKEGKLLPGVPNSELAFPFLLALAPNSASAFARAKFNPLDPQYQGNGKTIIDSKGNLVKLPDPEKFEKAFDDALLGLPSGNFESSPDGINNTTQIPSLFTFKSQPYGADGAASFGPFWGTNFSHQRCPFFRN